METDIIMIESESDDENDVFGNSQDNFDDEISESDEIGNDVNNELEHLNVEDAYKLMNRDILEVQNITGLSKQNTKALLNFFKYDKSMMLEKFYEIGIEKLFKSANINMNSEAINCRTITDSNNNSICQICFEGSDCLCLNCGHNTYCSQCWIQYLNAQILDEGALSIKCPEYKCEFILDDEMILSILSDTKVKEKYQYLISNSFVASNRNLKFCPEADCHRVVKSELIGITVQCKCGNFFCFECGDTIHEPSTCENVLRWEKLMKSDYGSKKWIFEHTKPCPKCHTPIQKNGGCNHMHCTRCDFHFCWVCFKSINNHRVCNQSDLNDGSSSSNLNDYDFDRYHNSFRLMNESLKLEQNFYRPRFSKENREWINYEFIKDAAAILFQNRRVLMYSYVFAYFIDYNNQKLIFEQNLENLRRSTEELSEILEREINSDNVKDLKQKVQDKAVFCNSRRKILVDFVQDGYNNNYWRDRLDENIHKKLADQIEKKSETIKLQISAAAAPAQTSSASTSGNNGNQNRVAMGVGTVNRGNQNQNQAAINANRAYITARGVQHPNINYNRGDAQQPNVNPNPAAAIRINPVQNASINNPTNMVVISGNLIRIQNLPANRENDPNQAQRSVNQNPAAARNYGRILIQGNVIATTPSLPNPLFSANRGEAANQATSNNFGRVIIQGNVIATQNLSTNRGNVSTAQNLSNNRGNAANQGISNQNVRTATTATTSSSTGATSRQSNPIPLSTRTLRSASRANANSNQAP